MKLSAGDIERALYCVNETVDRRRRTGTPVPDWMIRLGKRLDLGSLTSGMSRAGHESDSGGAALELGEKLTTVEAAKLLDLSPRQVRRLDLDAETIGGRNVYSRAAVIEYAQERRNGRHR